MKEVIATILICGFYTVSATAAAHAQTGHEEHHEGAPAAPAAPPAGMMQQMMPQMMQMMEKKAEEKMPAAKKELSTAGRLEMIPAMLAGGMAMPPAKMRRLMDHTFYLDRIPQLGLTAQQVEKLRAIRAACRRDNIRAAAELRLARLELEDLLEGEWTVEAAEKAVRTVRKLEGDIQVRHLKAVKEAQKVLTPEQLSQAAEDQEPEELFR